MSVSRRQVVLGSCSTLSALALVLPSHWPRPERDPQISHQFPAGSHLPTAISATAWRWSFAAEVEKRTNGALKFAVYPGSSLMKVNRAVRAVRKGALDMTLVPLSYAGGEVPELNIGLMPGLVTSYEQGYAWKKAEVGRR